MPACSPRRSACSAAKGVTALEMGLMSVLVFAASQWHVLLGALAGALVAASARGAR